MILKPGLNYAYLEQILVVESLVDPADASEHTPLSPHDTLELLERVGVNLELDNPKVTIKSIFPVKVNLPPTSGSSSRGRTVIWHALVIHLAE